VGRWICSGQPVRTLVDQLSRAFVRLVLGVFFRQVEVIGINRLPKTGATIFVGNHGNSLIDPALALGWLPTGVRFLAKSTLWRHPMVGPFVRLARAVPVYRQQDSGVDTSRNREMFSRCYEILSASGSIALFPEGMSHSEPQLQPLKTGAARLALGALRRHPGLQLRIVPFGLHFEDRSRFRSAALIEIGGSVDVGEHHGAAGEADRDAVLGLTRRIEAALGRVTISYGSWEEAHLIRRGATLFSREDGGGAAGLAGGLTYQRAFARAYDDIKTLHPEETASVRRALRDYDRRLALTGLRDRQVAAEYPRRLVVRFVLRHLLDLLVLLPVGFVGVLINWIPYRTPALVARLLPLDEDVRATYKLMISIFLFPLVWLGLCRLAQVTWGWQAALVVSVVAPLSGYAALLLKERLGRLIAESRAYLVLRWTRALASDLRAQRADLLGRIPRQYGVTGSPARKLEEQGSPRGWLVVHQIRGLPPTAAEPHTRKNRS